MKSSFIRKQKIQKNWEDGNPKVTVFKGHKGMVWDVQLDTSSGKLVSGAADKTVKEWQIVKTAHFL